MPNWCENDLYIRGKEVKNVLKFIDNEANDTVIDFDRIIPYPKEYKELDEKAEAYRRDLGKANKSWFKKFALARVCKKYNVEKPDYFAFKDGFNSGGYEWCIENWGTKWDAKNSVLMGDSEEEAMITFDTAWSPPLPVIKRLSEIFPEHHFVLNYFEGLIGFQGTYEVINGQVLEDWCSDYQGTRGG